MSDEQDPLTMEISELDENDVKIIKAMASRGIDSRLEAFCLSTFQWRYHQIDGTILKPEQVKDGDEVFSVRLHCNIHPDEMQVFMRRLSEYEASAKDEDLREASYLLMGDILELYYGIEEE